jgi:hypothetical protein
MKLAHFACLFLSVVAGMSGQSDPVPSPSHAPANVARQAQQKVPLNLPSLPRGHGFGEHRSGTNAASSSGLDFAPVVTYDSGGQSNVGGSLPTTSVVLTDVNGDGKLDIIAPNYQSNTFGVLLGNGDGTFKNAVTYASGGFEVISVAAGDINSDGKPDIVVANGLSSSVSVLLGNGDGTFQAPVTFATGGYNAASVAIADLNGDGKSDLVVANCSAGGGCGSSSGGIVSVLLGNGDATFQAPAIYGSGGAYASSIAIGDTNGDGKLDILVTDGAGSTVGVLLGNGDGTFQPVVAYGSGGFQAYSVTLVDVNGDGKPDLMVANLCINNGNNCPNGGVSVLLGNGDGTFQTAVTYASTASYTLSATVTDVNGDGKPDIVAASFCENTDCVNSTGAVDVLLGNGDGTFQAAVNYVSGGSYAIAVAVADVNGDSKPDIVVAGDKPGDRDKPGDKPGQTRGQDKPGRTNPDNPGDRQTRGQTRGRQTRGQTRQTRGQTGRSLF